MQSLSSTTPHDRARFTAALRIGASLFAATLLAGCGGLGASGGAGQKPAETAAAWQERLEADARAARHDAVIRDAGALARFGPLQPRTLALLAAAHQARGARSEAHSVGLQLVQRLNGDAGALSAFESLLRVLIDRADGREEAARLALAAWPQGCGAGPTCDVAARLLAAIELPAPAWSELAARLAPPGETGARLLVSVARSLAARRRFDLHRAAIGVARERLPGSAEVWGAALAATNLQRGPQAREAWVETLRRATLSTAALRAIAGHPAVLRDRLVGAMVLDLIVERPDATAADRLALVRSLAANLRRGATRAIRDRVAALARDHIDWYADDAGRLALADALLAAGQPGPVQELLAPLVARTPPVRRAQLLQAEWLRQRGDRPAAEQLAEAAVRGEPSLGAHAEAMWRAVWPELARRLGALAPADAASVEARLERAQRLATTYEPRPHDEAELMGTAHALDRAIADASAADRGRWLAHRRSLLEALDRVGSRAAWRPIAARVALVFCEGEGRDATSCDYAARFSYRVRLTAEGLRAWLLAIALAERAGENLDAYRMLDLVVDAHDPAALARWLEATQLRSPPEPNLGWRVARVLVLGSTPGLSRRWIAQVLAQQGGQAALLAMLPPLTRTSAAKAGQSRPAPRDLERAATGGAADLVIEHIAALREDAARRADVRAAQEYGRAEVLAHTTLGHGAEAERVLRWMIAQPGFKKADRRQMLTLALQANQCGVVLELAEQEATGAVYAHAQQAATQGLECAMATGDGPRLMILLKTLEGALLQTARQLYIADRLHRHGLHTLAVAWYGRLLIDPKAPAPPDTLLRWAESLLHLGRPGQADEVLARMLGGRQSLHFVRGAGMLLMRHGRPEAAMELVSRALKQNDNALLRTLRCAAALQAGDEAIVLADLQALVRGGVDQRTLTVLHGYAATSGHLATWHNALQELVDVDRTVERERYAVAAAMHDVRAMVASLAKMQARSGERVDAAVIAPLASVAGQWQRARTLAADRLAQIDADGSDPELSLAEAAAVRRDPDDPDETLAIGRLAVAGSLEPHAVAAVAAAHAKAVGDASSAAAFAAFAAEEGDKLARHIVAARHLWRAGKREEASNVLRAALARTLARPARTRSGRDTRDRERTELLQVELWLADIQEFSLRQAFLQLLIEHRPDAGSFWLHLAENYALAGDHARAVEVLGAAASRIRQWDRALITTARKLLDSGAGPAMAKAFAAHPEHASIHGDWAVAGIEALETNLAAVEPSARLRALAILRGSLAADSRGRLALARYEATHGRADAALTLLGDAPFAAVRLTSQREASEAEVARTAAAALIAATFDGSSPDELPDAAAARAWPRIDAIVARWEQHGTGRDDLLVVAGELARQGHPALGARLLQRVASKRSPFPADLRALAAALRAAIGDGQSEATRALLDAMLRAQVGWHGEVDVEQRRELVGLLLAASGDVALADQRQRDDHRRAPAPLGLWRHVGDGVDGPILARLRQFDRAALAELGSIRRPSLDVVLAALRLGLAAGQTTEALALVRRAAALHDEPWHITLPAAWLAWRWGASELARGLRSNAGGSAPAGLFACLDLALGRPDARLEACVRGRRLANLPHDALRAVTAAALRDADLGKRLVAAIASSRELERASTWIEIVADQVRLDPDRKPVARALVQALSEQIPTESGRRSVLVSAGDELAAVGVVGAATEMTNAALANRPHDWVLQNNVAYQGLLDGQPTPPLARTAWAAIRRTGGRAAAALLDTVAAIAHREGALGRAERYQRAALAAALPLDDILASDKAIGETVLRFRLGILPIRLYGSLFMHARLAAILADAGKVDEARKLAGWVLAVAHREQLLVRSLARAALRKAMAKPTPAPALTPIRKG